jgi:hypothetical protein
MKTWARNSLIVIAATGVIFAGYAAAMAETCTLELKRLESRTSIGPSDYIYRATQPQSFNAQVGPVGNNRIQFGGQDEQAKKFKEIVKKEPKYDSDNPFRGVAKFGAKEYAFALDTVLSDAEKEELEKKKKAEAEEKEKASKSKTEDGKNDDKDAKSKAASNLVGGLVAALSSSNPEAEQAKQPKAVGYNRLYFDANRNGDLTDDKVIEAEPLPQGVNYPPSYARLTFPRVDITIDADGAPVEYAFFLTGYVNANPNYTYAGVQINSAAYREGDITLDGKKRHLVLIDFNSNGRFDDEIKISDSIRRSGGQLYPEQGDMLLVDPNQVVAGYSSPYDPSTNSYQHYVSKMVDIDGRYYSLKISPAGDKITLEPSTTPLGKITNPNARFSAVIYGGNGFLKINGDKDMPVSVPEGEWKLLSYTIDLTNVPEPAKPEEKKEEKKDETKEKSALSALGNALESVLGGGATAAQPAVRRITFVTAGGTAKYKPVTVKGGETVDFPFGPPYKPYVSVNYFQGAGDNKQASLALMLIGSTGEVVSNMMVNGARPPKAEFTIKDPKGEVVQTGNFEYG